MNLNESTGSDSIEQSEQPANILRDSDLLLLCKHPGCLKEFTSKWSLTRHMKTHSGLKPFQCQQCNKQFVQKCSLTRHEQTHQNERPWVCDHDDCDKRFKLKEYLEVHRKSHALNDQKSTQDNAITMSTTTAVGVNSSSIATFNASASDTPDVLIAM